MLRQRPPPLRREAVPRDRSPLFERFSREDIAGIFELSHLRPEISVCFLEESFQPAERQLAIARQEYRRPQPGPMLEELIESHECLVDRSDVRSPLHVRAFVDVPP